MSKNLNADMLKKSILQYAVAGKLVKQDESDEPAKVLLEKIREEKEKLIKEKKIKRDKHESIIYRKDGSFYEKIGKEEKCIDDEIPFDIPESWEWCRLGSAFNIIMGQSPKGKYINDNDNGIEFHQSKSNFDDLYLKQSDKTTIFPTKIVEKNTVLLCVRAPVGILNITKRRICIGRGLCGINAYNNIKSKFIFYFLKTFKETFVKKSTGTTFSAITLDVVKQQLFPLPPLAEQHRIVEKIEEVLPLVEEYAKKEKALNHINDSFHETLKKSILQYAVEGKLVKQDKKDEPAKVLLEKIREEKEKLIKEKKIKRDKNESIIYRKDGSFYEKIGKEEKCIDDELPFDIPDSWEWCRLEQVSQIIGGFAFKSSEYIEQGVRIIRISDFDENGIKNTNIVRYKYSSKLEEYEILLNDILMCMTGGTVGKNYLVKNLKEKLYTNQRVATIRINKFLALYFINFVINSSYIKNEIHNNKNSTNDNISMQQIKKFFIPIPPLAEQHRIVEKIEELYKQDINSLC